MCKNMAVYSVYKRLFHCTVFHLTDFICGENSTRFCGFVLIKILSESASLQTCKVVLHIAHSFIYHLGCVSLKELPFKEEIFIFIIVFLMLGLFVGLKTDFMPYHKKHFWLAPVHVELDTRAATQFIRFILFFVHKMSEKCCNKL